MHDQIPCAPQQPATADRDVGGERDGPARPGSYAGAVAHYTSPDRRDAVKRRWEEPATHRLLDRALARVPDRPVLRVLDVGCGTADGLALLRSAPSWRRLRRAGTSLEYVGLDLDDGLLDVARARHADDPGVRFVLGDIRDGIPDGDVDLVVSSGVPFSHLTPGELEEALAGILRAVRSRPRPVALIVDVLGRYSVEWTSCWHRRRWPYRMSFFHGDQDPPTADMTCYGGTELAALLHRAADRAGCALAEVSCHDRSILVGRHTSTGEYTPGLRPYRALVNALHAGAEVALDDLRFDVDLPEAPDEIRAFYDDFGAAWNGLVDRAHASGGPDASRRPGLAEDLRLLEAGRQRGLGVGHSLTAVALTRPGR